MTTTERPPASGPPADSDASQHPRRVTEIGEPELIDRDPHPRAAVAGAVLLVVVILLGALGLGSLIGRDDGGRDVAQVVLPRFATRPMADAQAQLERMGLIVDIRFEPNEVVPADVVVAQEPIAGARVEVGEQVVLMVSDGPMGIVVPDLAGAQALEAARTLSVLGLEMQVEEAYDEEVPQGVVVRSDPSAEGRVPVGGTVTVTVSRGPEPRTVPDVVGLRDVEAFAAIGRADLEIAGVGERRVAGDAVGTVLSVDPEPGTEVPRDQPIRIVVGVETGPLEVPDVVGLTRDSAVAALSGDGLRARVRTEAVPPGDRRIGRVISQTPIVGTGLGSGDSVTITVGEAAAPPPPAVPPAGAPPPPTSTTAPP